ncbi:fibronectin type III domain-containing protein [bacterium]|nr:fibronectin type III domain-containing protein [bacterium]
MRYSIIALVAVVCMGVAGTATAGSPGATPDYLHLSWLHDPATTMTVMWRTNTGITASVVQYGLTNSYGSEQTGAYALLPEGRGNSHTVELTGLAPNTTYHYRVGDGGSNWDSDRTFRTAPDDVCEPFRFMAMGDSRSSTGDGASIYWSTVFDAATDETPLFVIFNGDAIAEGDKQEDGWEQWFENAESDLRTQPMMMAWGNHEDRGGSAFLDNFAMPVNDVTSAEDFYDFQVGPVHFFALDTEHGVPQYQSQAAWMGDKLAATDAVWTLAYQHRPTYSSGTTHGSEDDCQDFFEPVFDLYELDINIGSHDHIYERTKPIRNGSPIAGEDYSRGTMYLVTGGAGAFVNPILNIFNNFYLKGIGATHYIMFDVEFNRVTLTAKSEIGVVYDTITLEKPELGFPTADIAAVAGPVNVGDTVHFDGSLSSDPCGNLIDYAWDYGDGDTGSGPNVQHVYSEDGLMTVTLTVMDTDGNYDSTSIVLDVQPAPVDDDAADDDAVDDDAVDDDAVDDDAVDDDAVDDDALDDDAVDDDALDDDAADDDALDADADDDDDASDDDDMSDDDGVDDDFAGDDDSAPVPGGDDDDDGGGGCGC